MKLVILKTNIRSKRKVNRIKPIFNNMPSILNWSIDTQDIDNVLRIEATENLHEVDIIHLIKKYGFYAEALSD